MLPFLQHLSQHERRKRVIGGLILLLVLVYSGALLYHLFASTPQAEEDQRPLATMTHGDSLISHYAYVVRHGDTLPHGKSYTRRTAGNRLAYIATYRYGLKEEPLVLYGDNGRVKAELQYHRDVLHDTTVLFGKRRQPVTYKIFDAGVLQRIIHLDDDEQPFLTFRVVQDTLPLLRGTYHTVDQRQTLCLKDGAYTFSDGRKEYEGECLFDYPYDLSLVHAGDTVAYKIRYYSSKRIMLEGFGETEGCLPASFDGICLEGD